MRIHDSHVHIWAAQPPCPEYEVIPGFIATLESLLQTMDAHGVGRAAVVTPRAMGWDNSVTLAAARSAPDRIVPIGLLNLEDPAIGADLIRQAEAGLAGVRLSPLNCPDRQLLAEPALWPFWEAAAARQIPVHLHIAPAQLKQVVAVAEAFPTATIVIDHLGRPDVEAGPASPGFRTFLELARYPGIWAKTPDSGFFSRAGAPYADLLPFVREALSAYGASRLLWGSDWPLCQNFGRFPDAREPWWGMAGLAEADRQRIFAGNFDRLYPTPQIREGSI